MIGKNDNIYPSALEIRSTCLRENDTKRANVAIVSPVKNMPLNLFLLLTILFLSVGSLPPSVLKYSFRKFSLSLFRLQYFFHFFSIWKISLLIPFSAEGNISSFTAKGRYDVIVRDQPWCQSITEERWKRWPSSKRTHSAEGSMTQWTQFKTRNWRPQMILPMTIVEKIWITIYFSMSYYKC